jgi:hypothetical protein
MVTKYDGLLSVAAIVECRMYTFQGVKCFAPFPLWGFIRLIPLIFKPLFRTVSVVGVFGGSFFSVQDQKGYAERRRPRSPRIHPLLMSCCLSATVALSLNSIGYYTASERWPCV